MSARLLRFTTENYSPESRVHLWEGHNARALIPLDIRTLESAPMRSRQTNLHLPSIRMADVTGTSQIVERSEAFINDHPTGMIAVFFALEGEAFFFHRGGHLTLQPGQAVLYDADLPFTRGFSRGLRAYNLAWKLAAVLKGQAGEDLLETYSVERAPIAKQIVTRANNSSREYQPIFDALGVSDATTDKEFTEKLKLRKEATPEGAERRKALRQALDNKDFEFNAQGTEIGQFYQSTAVVCDGLGRPEVTEDPMLHHQKSTYPGLRLPHAWIGDTLNKQSTHDIATGTGFTLFTGINGKPWADAAQRVARALDIELKAVVIGEGLEHQDLYGDWLRQREVEEDGVILVRPDKHIAWRSHRLVEDPEHALTAVLSSILSRGGNDNAEEVARLMAAAKVAVG